MPSKFLWVFHLSKEINKLIIREFTLCMYGATEPHVGRGQTTISP